MAALNDPMNPTTGMSEWKLRLIGMTGGMALRAWGATARVQFRSTWEGDRYHVFKGQSFILCTWHESLLLPLWFLSATPFHTLVSQSGDGELIARVCQNLGWKTFRGSSSNGGAGALRDIIRTARSTTPFRLALTVDGPRGPRRQCKDGAIYLASRLGIPMLPAGVALTQAWRARSWDRFAVPMPFSRVAMVFSPPLAVPPKIDSSCVDSYRRLLEEAMFQAERDAEQLLSQQRVGGVNTVRQVA